MYRVFYTLSDIWDFPSLLDDSLASIRRFIKPKDIIVFYTPPINKEHFDKLKKQGYQVYIKPKPKVGIRYAAKNYLCDIETEDLFFLDCDTIINKNILDLLEEKEYLFAARPAARPETAYYHKNFKREIWNQTFEQLGLETLPMFNSGFLIFRKNLHNRIKEDWMKYLKMYLSGDLGFPAGKRCTNQYALTLAISKNVKKHDIWILGPECHAFEWDRDGRDAHVYHRATYSPGWRAS